MKTKALLLIVSIMAFGLFAFIPRTMVQPQPWPVPDAYKNKVNPLKGDAESLVNGKALYNQHCKSCHGTKGKGDGPKASQLDTDCGDFTKSTFHSQTDGSLFYKTFEGRKDMPAYKKKIPDQNDIWAIVNYMRTFK
ncbi:MAG: c-type cytochrome [Chitinophagaceae bacterium]|nr:c-type cytochrome [Chitinophagaceae bacterium]HQV60813.1 c-type cytochrome [Chitinophagaceae bacterium]HQV86523.1 c-type cytochrome [Chitinophagaceae bacterium]HQX73242.1 c-type cytochrome [Chitinophagaceae bacterium]HQZ74227.1 c-type cytochrome [Chitinophagaceae bacterium]